MTLEKSGEPEQNRGTSTQPESPAQSVKDRRPPDTPEFATLHTKPWLIGDLLRMLLIILSLVVAGGLVLILLPQPKVDQMAKDLQSRHAKSKQEIISLLYLGDETSNNEFHIRGVVRNITSEPIEQLDAVVRLYAHDGTILETTVVRMNKETIAPDETSQFELVYPNYKSEFAKYSVEFKLREGDLVSYKDMRATQ